MKPSVPRILFCVFAVFFAVSAHALAQSPKAVSHAGVTDLGPSSPLAINDSGLAVGGVWITSNGKSTTLVGPFGNGIGTNLVAVNNRGQILLAQKFGPLRYFIYDPNRKDLTPIGIVGQVNEGGAVRSVYLAYLTGLDEDGRVFGVYAGTGNVPCAVVGKPTLGTPGDLGPPPSAPANYGLVGCLGGFGGSLVIHAINRNGQITGSAGAEGFVWSDGKLTTFAFPGSISTEGDAINDAGIVAGHFTLTPGYAISETGVITPYPRPGSSVQKGFVYDGQQFRFVNVPQSWASLYKPAGTLANTSLGILVTGINNRGQIVGFYAGGAGFQGFVADIASMPSTGTGLTEAAAARKLSSPQSAGRFGGGFDQAYKILQEGVGQPAASTLRALQALQAAAGPLPPEMVVPIFRNYSAVSSIWDINEESTTYNIYYRGKSATAYAMLLLLQQLSVAQQTEKGATAVVDAVAALAGEQGVADLRAAGQLVPGSASLTPQGKLPPDTLAKFKDTLYAAIVANQTSHPLEIPPSDLKLWQPSQLTPEQLALLDKTLRTIKEQLGPRVAAVFLAQEELALETAYKGMDPTLVTPPQAGNDVGAMFWLWTIAQFVELKTQGQLSKAEQALRAFAGAPEPANCPGLALLRASGTFRDDNQPNDPRVNIASVYNARHGLGDVIGQIAAKIFGALQVRVASAPVDAHSTTHAATP